MTWSRWRGRRCITKGLPPIAQQDRKASPLQRGGTLQGEAAAGKDASDKFKAMAAGERTASLQPQVIDGKFSDPRWKEGRWVLESFRDPKGNMDWDAVITAEMTRRRMLEGNPIPSGAPQMGGGLGAGGLRLFIPSWGAVALHSIV